ncbi:hypothetical protein L0156_06825 [bacterium]|nr:hypothetical protein [bacterium]
MKTELVLAWIWVTILCTNAYPCGDKFLVVGRGVRYEQVNKSKYPASLLIYSKETEASEELQSIFKKAGHRVRTVHSENALDSYLNSGNYDVVLVSFSDAPIVEEKIYAAASKPYLLPFLYNTQEADLAKAAKQYSCLLKSNLKRGSVLRTIEEIMAARLKGKSLHCEKI